jgi:hypothetical protein
VPVVDIRPARVIRVAGEDVLDIVNMVASGGDISLAQRKRVQRPAIAPGLGKAP